MAKKPRPKGDASASQDKIYGKHSVKAVLLARPQDVARVILAGKEEYHADLIELAQRRNIDVFLVPWPDFEKAGKFAETDKHQGALAFVKPRKIYVERDFPRLEKAKCVVVLDQVSNPQNMATILRSAAFFRANAVVYMKHRSATPTAEVVRFAVGGAELVDLYCVTNVAQGLDALKDMNFAVLGLDERGEKTLADCDLSQPTAFVIGAEGEGLRKKTKEHCTDLVRIPGGRTGLESLNAGIATTIALYEFARLMG